MNGLIFDAIVLAVLIFFGWRGYRKGLILTLFGLVAIFVAMFGANALATRFEPMAVEFLTPRFEATLTEQFIREVEREQEKTPEVTFEELPVSGIIVDVLGDMGLFENLADDIAASVQETAHRTAQSIASAVAAALAKIVAQTGLFFLFFLIILIIWFIISHILNIAFKLPVLRTLNGAGGLILGALKGGLIVWVVIFALQIWSSSILSEEALTSSILLRWFINHNPILLFMKG